jgi:hypothetical protein
MIPTLLPAYGRDYKSKAAIADDLNNNKDFIMIVTNRADLITALSVAISYQSTITNLLQMTATFRITTSYGMIRCYPVNATAKLLCDLSGFKTLTTDALSIIEDLGYTCLNTINDSLITRNSLI